MCYLPQDEFYNRYLVRQKLFEPVIEVFMANGERYNLLNSAVLELFDFIRKVRCRGIRTPGYWYRGKSQECQKPAHESFDAYLKRVNVLL